MTPEFDDDGSGEDATAIDFTVDAGTLLATFQNDATEDEAAAIAAAVAAHLNGENEPQGSAQSLACLWTVAGRLEPATGRRPHRRQDLPGDCPTGEEWAFAGRCR